MFGVTALEWSLNTGLIVAFALHEGNDIAAKMQAAIVSDNAWVSHSTNIFVFNNGQ